jgi:hypothetical protein
MSITDHHARLSQAASAWLLAIANPLNASATRTSRPAALEIAPILHAAELHGVLPAALRALRWPIDPHAASPIAGSETEVENAKRAVAAAKTRQIHQAGFELLLRHHGEKIIGALHAAGITAAIVKGPIFARRLYAEPAMRSFTDIDILLPLPARGAASDILRSLGFELYARDYRAGQDYCEDNWLLVDDPRVGIEIHSNLVHNPKLRQTASVTFDHVADAGNGSTEDATALLFVAAAHAAISHQFDRLQHLVDIALAANDRAGKIDIERLSRSARGSGVLTAVHAALCVTGTAFDDPCCIAMAEALRPSALDRAASGLITPSSVLAAWSSRRSGSSWRRKALRQAIRVGGLVSPWPR